jgi:glycerol-3-phosphate dehydrogenase
LTSSLAIAEHVRTVMEERMGLKPAPVVEEPEPPVMPYIGQAGTRPYADAMRISGDPAYGEVVCFCERVSRGEIRDALKSDIPPSTVEGLRRRTRAGMGRCQGFFCGAAVRQMLDEGADAPVVAEVVT